jgi:Flagellar hook-length control protein FliK
VKLTPLLPSTASAPGGAEPGAEHGVGQPSDGLVFRAALAAVAGLGPPCSAASGEPTGAVLGASSDVFAGVVGGPFEGSTTGTAPTGAPPDGSAADDPAGTATPAGVGGAELALLAQLAGLQGVEPRIALPASDAPAASPPAAGASGEGSGTGHALGSVPQVAAPGAGTAAGTPAPGSGLGTTAGVNAGPADGLARSEGAVSVADDAAAVQSTLAGSATSGTETPSLAPGVPGRAADPAPTTAEAGTRATPPDSDGSGGPTGSGSTGSPDGTSSAAPARDVATTGAQNRPVSPALGGRGSGATASRRPTGTEDAASAEASSDPERLHDGLRGQQTGMGGAAPVGLETAHIGVARGSARTPTGRAQPVPRAADATNTAPAARSTAGSDEALPSTPASGGHAGDAGAMPGSAAPVAPPSTPATGPAVAGGAPPAASGPGRTDAPTSTVPVPDQVLRHLASVRALREGGHRTVLRLEPEHLGEVTVTVDVRAGAVRMAVSGGTAALAAVRDGLQHLRASLADSGLDLGDVALRPDAASAVPAATSSAAPGSDDGDPVSGTRPDAGTGAGATGGEQRPAREQPRAGPVDVPESPSAGRGRRAAAAAEAGPDAGNDTTGRPQRLDVRL